TCTDYEDILEAFGPWVAEAVAALTDLKALPKDRREKEYHDRLARADWRVLLIKLGDAYDNLADSGSDEGLRAKNLRKSGKVVELSRPRAGESPLLARALQLVEDLRRKAGAAD